MNYEFSKSATCAHYGDRMYQPDTSGSGKKDKGAGNDRLNQPAAEEKPKKRRCKFFSLRCLRSVPLGLESFHRSQRLTC